ncbi:uncharacterized protein BDV14DRAFT_195829 [Aspergillus stella-maris]|uniref:uncharacterized protein n=1 Tax=Aspergillus stella-maris TaxID=1810926 RepID=UPI003CCDD44C
MEPQEMITLSLDDYNPASGQVKSDLPDEHARYEGSNLSVAFQMLYEVHGDHKAPNRVQDASLLVVKMIPSSHKPKEHLVSFKVTLTVLPDDQQKGYLGWDQAPILTSYEPSSSGAQHIKVLTTNETLERAFEGALQFDALGAAPGVKGTRTRKTEYEKQHLLQIRSGTDRHGSLPVGKRNTVWWQIQAADVKNSGIGDSFTVALLIHRASASSFQLQATVDSEIGNLAGRVKEFIPSGLRSRKLPTVIGRYGPGIGEQSTEMPPGIDRNNLGAASKNNVITALKEIGLHRSEEAKLANYGDAGSGLQIPAMDNTAPDTAHSNSPALDYSMRPRPGPHVAQRESDHTRMQRHRRMAALYERLAELHREEARQYLSEEEFAYARQVEEGWSG